MSATVLVTGAGGFVGAAVTRCLVRRLAERTLQFSDGSAVQHVAAMVRPGATLDRLEDVPRNSATCSIEQCDITDAAAFRCLLARLQPRTVLHLAMDRAVQSREDDAARRLAIDGPLEEMFVGLREQPGARVVFTSSVWVLPAGDRLDEQTPPQPMNAYARNKVRAEALLPVLNARTGVDWINLRLFNIFGRYEAPTRLLPYLVERLSRGQDAVLGNADAIRDFTDVDTIADAYAAAVTAGPSACSATYHIGSGRGMTIRSFAATVADVTGHAERIRVGGPRPVDADTPCQVANPERAKRTLGWSAGPDVHADIRSAARWWLDRPGR